MNALKAFWDWKNVTRPPNFELSTWKFKFKFWESIWIIVHNFSGQFFWVFLKDLDLIFCCDLKAFKDSEQGLDYESFTLFLYTSLCSGFIDKTLSWGFWKLFSTGTYASIGTTCVEFENVMKITTKKIIITFLTWICSFPHHIVLPVFFRS